MAVERIKTVKNVVGKLEMRVKCFFGWSILLLTIWNAFSRNQFDLGGALLGILIAGIIVGSLSLCRHITTRFDHTTGSFTRDSEWSVAMLPFIRFGSMKSGMFSEIEQLLVLKDRMESADNSYKICLQMKNRKKILLKEISGRQALRGQAEQLVDELIPVLNCPVVKREMGMWDRYC